MTKFAVIFFCFLCAALAFAIPANLTFAEEVKKVRYCPYYCSCSEADLLKSRIAEAEGAIKGFEAVKSSRGNAKFSQNEYIKIKGEVTKDINSELKSRGLAGFGCSATTHPATCGITIKCDGSPCIQESLRRHEKIHQDKCIKKTGRVGAAGSASGLADGIVSGASSDYRHGMTISEYCDEEISAYNTELAYLRSELDKLNKSCRGLTLEFDDANSNIGKGRSGDGAYKGGGRAYTCERRRLTNIESDTETWKKLKSFFGD